MTRGRCGSLLHIRMTLHSYTSPVYRRTGEEEREPSPCRVLIALLLTAELRCIGQEVTQAEKDRALQYLETTKKKFWRRRRSVEARELQAGAGPWSGGTDDGAHRRSEDFIRDLVKEKVMMGPPGSWTDVKKTDEGAAMFRPLTKAQRTALVPTNRFGHRTLDQAFRGERATTANFLKTTTACAITSRQPAGKAGWLQFILLSQLTANGTRSRSIEVKADPIPEK